MKKSNESLSFLLQRIKSDVEQVLTLIGAGESTPLQSEPITEQSSVPRRKFTITTPKGKILGANKPMPQGEAFKVLVAQLAPNYDLNELTDIFAVEGLHGTYPNVTDKNYIDEKSADTQKRYISTGVKSKDGKEVYTWTNWGWVKSKETQEPGTFQTLIKVAKKQGYNIEEAK